jgi:hypothetical protein
MKPGILGPPNGSKKLLPKHFFHRLEAQDDFTSDLAFGKILRMPFMYA